MSLSFTRHANWTAPVATSTGGRPMHVKMLCCTPAAIVDILRTTSPTVTLAFAGMPLDGRVIATHYNHTEDMMEFIIESESFSPVVPGSCIEKFDVTITRVAESAGHLLREVHQNNLDGFLYSGPVRKKVAEFLGMPEIAVDQTHDVAPLKLSDHACLSLK